MIGQAMMSWIKDLFPLNRSLSGNGNRETLLYLKGLVPELKINNFASGEIAYDWTVPEEWNILDAYIETASGERVAQFKQNNLHLVGYSAPINEIVSKSELLKHLHFLPEYPEAIPYVTSYYERNWGFCLTMQQFESLGDGPFRIFIDSSFKSGEQGGVLNYGEVFIPGDSTQEVLFSTYICHPSMANNELSGPVIATALAQYISRVSHHYSYRFLFLPETIGSIAYIQRNLNSMKKSIIAGWVLTCLGDAGDFSYIPSRLGNTYADKITVKTLEEFSPDYKKYSWLERGSDERQYCSPGVDLPFCSITRSKYGTFKEYHTSMDDLTFVSQQSIEESFTLFCSIVAFIEKNRVPKVNILCEPQLGRRGLYPNLSKVDKSPTSAASFRNVISFLDGSKTIQEVAELSKLSITQVQEIISIFIREGIVDI